MSKKILSFSNLTLLVALSLSSVAAYYSIIGLTAIFAGAVIPVIIMGSILEVGKITTTVWLRKYWSRASWVLKLYLVPAVIALALLTSMGIFGFLSKAHMDQGMISGDVQSKIAIYDEKIKTEKENIEANRKALKQMDEGVDQVLGRSTTETGAERAVAMRKSQQKERSRLQAEISQSQKSIAELNDARAPIAAEVRKVEAEVGPIKYIAALIYGDNTDTNMLEAAVRWVIILLVVVFDPLAIALVLAANASKEWDKEDEEGDSPLGNEHSLTPTVTEPLPESWPFPAYEPDDGPLTENQLKQIKESVDLPKEEVSPEEPIGCYKCGTELINAPGIGLFCPNKNCDVADGPFEEVVVDDTPSVEEEEAFNQMDSVTIESKPITIEPTIEEQMADTIDPVVEFEGIKDPNTNEWVQTGPTYKNTTSMTSTYKDVGDGYVEFEGKKMSKRVLQSMRPDLFILQEDNPREIEISYGASLPNTANMGDTFIRTDSSPHRVYKFNGVKWIEVDKTNSGAYLSNIAYLESLMEKIASGEYDPDLLTDYEQEAIANHIKTS
jgi:hypothetical protein